MVDPGAERIRVQGHGGQPFRLAPDPPQRRAHDDVVDPHRGVADRLRLRDRPVPRTDAADAGHQKRPRFPDAARYLGLALIACGILALVISIWQYWWTLRYLWRGGFAQIAGMTKEGHAIAGDRGRHPAHPHRPLCLPFRAAAPRLATDRELVQERRTNRRSRDAAKRQAQYPHPLGRRHRLVEHQLQQSRPDGLPDAQYRPHRQRRRRPSPTITASRAAPRAAPPSSPGRTRSAPA